MKLFAVPGLYCPFDTIVHPDRSLIDAHTQQFIADFHLVETQEKFDHYCSQQFAAMIARSYPMGTFYDLAAWCDMNTLLFILDDHLDEGDIMKDKAALSQFETQFMEILYAKKFPVADTGNPMLNALGNIWERMVARSGKTYHDRIIRGFKDMFSGGMWQYELIKKGAYPGIEEYFEVRQYLGAANLATDSLELTGQVNLSEEIYQDSKVIRMTTLARNAICFANDLFSLSKEIAQSASPEFNLVTILKRTRGISLEEAILETAVIHDEVVKEFIELEKGIYIFPLDINLQLSKYIEGLQHLMIGNIMWSTKDTSRYPHMAMGRA